MSEKYFDALAAKIDAAMDNPCEFITNMTNKLARDMDKFLLEQFERHGYSRDEVMDLAVARKIRTVDNGTITTYFVNDLALFSIMQMEYTLADADDGYYNFTAKLICEDLTPAVMGERSDVMLSEAKRE